MGAPGSVRISPKANVTGSQPARKRCRSGRGKAAISRLTAGTGFVAGTMIFLAWETEQAVPVKKDHTDNAP
jgi:hypothetical protein